MVERDAAAGLENFDPGISQFIVVVINSTKITMNPGLFLAWENHIAGTAPI